MVKDIESMNLDGGCLCLDFVNTVHSRIEIPLRDYLHSYEDMVKFADHTGILSKKQQQYLLAYAAKYPGKAKYAYRKIKKAREELFNLFYRITEGKRPTAGMLDYFNKLLSVALSHLYIKPSDGNKMQLAWKEEKDLLLLPLWMVIKSAYDVLLNEPTERIKACPACLWLFLDKTKNNKRRWCNSLSCGSIDKASRYYYRKKEEKGEA